jgi:hypothetical protein
MCYVKGSARLKRPERRFRTILFVSPGLSHNIIPPSVIRILRLIRAAGATVINNRIITRIEVEVSLGLTAFWHILGMKQASHIQNVPGVGINIVANQAHVWFTVVLMVLR